MEDTNDVGFIRLNRRFFSDTLWNEARTFSSCEAWIDLIQSARFEATPRKVCIGGREVTYSRGQLPASVRYLSKRWTWGERRVRSFLSILKKEGLITVENLQGTGVITLCKYNEYCGSDTAKDTGKDTANGLIQNELNVEVTQPKTQPATHPPKVPRTEKTGNKQKLSKTESTLKRKDGFYESLVPFLEIYPKETLRSFFDYWSEMNRSGTKMRFEQQPTWETAKRLATWANREKKYESHEKRTIYEQKRADSERRKSEILAEYAEADRKFIAEQEAKQKAIGDFEGVSRTVKAGGGL